MITAAFPYQKQRRRVQGLEMAYVEVGEGAYKYRFFYPRARACSRARRFCLFRRSFSLCVFFLCKAEGLSCFWGVVMVWGQEPACKIPTANGWDWYCMASRISLPRTTQLKRRAGS